MAKSYRSMRMYLAFFCVFVSALLGITRAAAIGQQANEPSSLDPLGKEADQRVGWKILQDYRLIGVVDDYRFGFELRIMPHREKTRKVSGLMIGIEDSRMLNSRVDFLVNSKVEGDPKKTYRMLLENGLAPLVWQSGGVDDLETGLLDSSEYLTDLVGSGVSTFELLMPFKHWQSFYYEGETDFRSRKVNVFWMFPPKEDVALSNQLSGVRLYLDSKFNSMIRAEVFSSEKEHLKTLSLIDLKKVDGVWIPKELKVRNEKTRSNTVIRILDASVGLGISPYYLGPEALHKTIIGENLVGEDIGEPVSFE